MEFLTKDGSGSQGDSRTKYTSMNILMDEIVLVRWDGVWVDQQEPARVRAAMRLRELGVTIMASDYGGIRQCH